MIPISPALIRDDILRTFGDLRSTGTSSSVELRSFRPHLLLVEALQHGSTAEVMRLRDLLGKPWRTDAEVEEVRAMLVSTGAKPYNPFGL